MLAIFDVIFFLFLQKFIWKFISHSNEKLLCVIFSLPFSFFFSLFLFCFYRSLQKLKNNDFKKVEQLRLLSNHLTSNRNKYQLIGNGMYFPFVIFMVVIGVGAVFIVQYIVIICECNECITMCLVHVHPGSFETKFENNLNFRKLPFLMRPFIKG